MRTPFDLILKKLKKHEKKILSVDVPSGWNIEEGPGNLDETIIPFANISLMLPKHCMKEYKGRHFLGGRFMSQHVLDEFKLIQPDFPGDALFYEIDPNHQKL